MEPLGCGLGPRGSKSPKARLRQSYPRRRCLGYAADREPTSSIAEHSMVVDRSIDTAVS